jgi:5-methyltetrahydropteroyltriglutamate--homocysteine methyltransferase
VFGRAVDDRPGTRRELKTSDRYLTTHVGSMRPARSEFNQAAAGEASGALQTTWALRSPGLSRKLRHRCHQHGEFGKRLASTGRLTGFEMRDIELKGPSAAGTRGPLQTSTRPTALQSTVRQASASPITYIRRPALCADVDNLKAALQGVKVEEAFLPVIAPCSISVNYKNEYYKSDEEFLFAVAEVARSTRSSPRPG